MNKPAKVLGTETVEDELRYMDARTAGLAKLRAKFEPNQISKLPKPTKKQTEEVNADFKKGVRCKECGAWHHPDVVHLDYVGHAALTDRLLDVDPEWSWEPAALTDAGLPAFDASGGLWIRLTVLGVTRLGYGHAKAKPNQDPGAREKEVIGDALRNAAMRFGAALDLWHKGDLHADEEEAQPKPVEHQHKAAATPQHDEPAPTVKTIGEAAVWTIQGLANTAKVSSESICKRAGVNALADLTEEQANAVVKKLKLTIDARKNAIEDVLEDSIPY